jgi:hypothetical protein
MGSNTTHDTTIVTGTRPGRRRRRRRLAALTLVSTIALAACGGDDDSSSFETAADEPAAEEPAADTDLVRTGQADDADAAIEAAPGTAAGGDSPAIDLGAIGRDVIIEMTVSMTSDDIERTVSAITTTASQLGGGVASSDIDYGDPAQPEQRAGRAWIVVKVPPAAVDRLLSGLDDAGTVRSINQSAQDVTDQLVDLDVRIRNARESVANVREFMDRTENLNDLVALEAELTRRQTDLERLEAQQRNLSDRVALSTITIEVVPPTAIPEPAPVPEDDGLAGALRDGWGAFTDALYAVVYVLAALLPFLVTGGIALLGAWWLARRRTSATRSAPIAPQPVAGAHDDEAADATDEHEDEPQPVG